MAEHTPGPWRSDSPYVSAPSGEHRKIVADCDQHFSDDECEANTRLIAAAPDLLAALEGLMHPHGGVIGTTKVIATAKAAIVKARGEADPTSEDEERPA